MKLVFAVAMCITEVVAADSQNAPIPPPPATTGFSIGPTVTGSIRADYFQSSRALDNTDGFWGMTGQVKWISTWADGVDTKLDARLHLPDVTRDAHGEVQLVEAFLLHHANACDIRVGRQIVAWGRADAINPTDNLSSRDYTTLLPFDDDQRGGVDSVKFDYYIANEYTVTLFATPFFKPSTLPFPKDLRITEHRPDHALGNTEVALKLSSIGAGTDWSLSYFHGFSQLPDLHPINDAAFDLRYSRIDVLGADVAHNFGRYGTRGEIAYVLTEDPNGTDPFVKNPSLFYVIGADRSFWGQLNFNVQLIGRYIYNYRAPDTLGDADNRAIVVHSTILNDQQDKRSYRMSSRISNKWLNDTLEAEYLVIYSFTRHDWYMRPLVVYAVNDDVKVSVGADYYHGDSMSLYGTLKRNQGMFIEVKQSF